MPFALNTRGGRLARTVVLSHFRTEFGPAIGDRLAKRYFTIGREEVLRILKQPGSLRSMVIQSLSRRFKNADDRQKHKQECLVGLRNLAIVRGIYRPRNWRRQTTEGFSLSLEIKTICLS